MRTRGNSGGGGIAEPDEIKIGKANASGTTFTFSQNTKRVIISYFDYYNAVIGAVILKNSGGEWKRASVESSAIGTTYTDATLGVLPGWLTITETANSITLTGAPTRTVLYAAMAWF